MLYYYVQKSFPTILKSQRDYTEISAVDIFGMWLACAESEIFIADQMMLPIASMYAMWLNGHGGKRKPKNPSKEPPLSPNELFSALELMKAWSPTGLPPEWSQQTKGNKIFDMQPSCASAILFAWKEGHLGDWSHRLHVLLEDLKSTAGEEQPVLHADFDSGYFCFGEIELKRVELYTRPIGERFGWYGL